MRILVVADGLEPLLHHSVVGLADRGHHVRVMGATSPLELDPVDRFRLSGSLKVSADRDRTGRRGRRTAAALAGVVARNPSGLAEVAGGLRRQHGIGGQFRRQLTDVLPVLAEHADVVYFEAAYVAAELAVALDLLPPKVIMCTGSDLRIMPDLSSWLRRALPDVFARTARIVCRSKDLQEWAVRRGAPPGRTEVLYPGVDLDVFSPRPRPPRRDGVLRMVSVGRLHWVKGYEYAVQATHLGQRRGHQLAYTIVGGNSGTGAAIDIAVRDLGLDDWVRRTGPKPVAGVRAALARSDVFVVPSVSEGVSRAAQEAMAMGLPVITTDAGGMAEIVSDGVEGFVVPQRDPAALCDAMVALAADPTLRVAMGERAAARAQAFDATRHLDRLEAILSEYARV